MTLAPSDEARPPGALSRDGRRPPLSWANVGAKAALLALLAHAALFPDLPQYEGKGIGWRLLLYPVGALLVPLCWLALRRRVPTWRYPHLVDLLVVSPFLIDTAGNAANLYDSVTWWDDAMHFVTWVPWVMAFGLVFRWSQRSRLVVFWLTAGSGAITHIVWELLEYVAFIRTNPDELDGAYTDTMGDLLLSLLGSFSGAAVVVTVLWRAPHPDRASPRPQPSVDGANVSGTGRWGGT